MNNKSLIIAGIIGTALAAQGDIILSGDFSSHGGTTNAIPTAGNVTAVTGVSSLGTDITTVLNGSAGVFDLDGGYVNRAAFSNLSQSDTTYMAFDFTTSSGMSITNASIAWAVGNGNGGSPSIAGRTAGNAGFDIYQGASLVGSWTADFGNSSVGVTTTSITGPAIELDAATTYQMRFVDLPTVEGVGDDVRGVLNYTSFEVTGSVVPEPSTLALLGAGGAMLMAARRKSLTSFLNVCNAHNGLVHIIQIKPHLLQLVAASSCQRQVSPGRPFV